MKICIEYNGHQAEIEKPDHNYGSNIGTFREIAALVFAGVELKLDGEINEVGAGSNCGFSNTEKEKE